MKKFLVIAIAVLLAASCGQPQPAQESELMSKDFLTLAAERYSVRHFTDQVVEQEKIDKIIEAGKIAPTAVNSQPQMVYVVKSPEAVAKLNRVSPCIYGAPQVFVFCYNDQNVCPRGEGNYGDIDVTIVLTHMMLEAANLGVGTCIVGYFDQQQLIDALELPSNMHPVLIMPFGYAADDAVPSPRHSEFRDLSETVAYK